MTADMELEKAKVAAEAAKARLMGATHDLQARVAPQRLANDAIETAKERGAAALDGAAGFARRKPAVIAAAAVGFLAFLARRRIVRLVRRRREPDRIMVSAGSKRVLPRPAGDTK